MSLVTHYKPSLLCLKLKHLQAFHGFCQAAHLPYISLIGGPHRMETCAHTGQQSCSFAGDVGPPGCEESHVCAEQIIRLTAHTHWAQQQTESKDKGLHSTKELHQAKTRSSSQVYAKHNMHTLRFILMSFRLKPSYFRLQHTGLQAVKGRRDGLLGRSCTE